MLCLHFDTCNIAQTRDRAVVPAFDDDVFKFIRGFEATANIDRQLELHTGIIGRTADDARSNLNVLALNGGDHLARGQIAFGNFVGVEPHPHRVITRTKQPNLTNTANTRQTVAHM